MKSAVAALGIFVLVAIGSAAVSAPGAMNSPVDRETLAVLYFDNHSGQAKYDPLGKGIAAMMITDLSNVPNLQLVEREHLQDIIDELDMQQSEYFDPATAARLGRLAGASYVLTGALSAVEPRIHINTRVVRIETGEIVKTAEVTGREDKFFELQQKLADQLMDDLELALSPEDRERLLAQQEANRVDELETMLAYSQALSLFDRENYVGAAEKMYGVLRMAPGSMVVRLTYDEMKDRAGEKAERKTRNKLRDLIRSRIPGLSSTTHSTRPENGRSALRSLTRDSTLLPLVLTTSRARSR